MYHYIPTGPQTTNIQIRSVPSDVRRGEDLELVCEVENEPAAAITWRRMEGELPFQAQTCGNRLRIPNVQSGGIYLCTATTSQGLFEEQYGFVIRGKYGFCYLNFILLIILSIYLYLCTCTYTYTPHSQLLHGWGTLGAYYTCLRIIHAAVVQ